MENLKQDGNFSSSKVSSLVVVVVMVVGGEGGGGGDETLGTSVREITKSALTLN